MDLTAYRTSASIARYTRGSIFDFIFDFIFASRYGNDQSGTRRLHRSLIVWTRLLHLSRPLTIQTRPSHANLRFCPVMNNELRNYLSHTAATAAAAVAERTSANVNMYMHVHASDLASRMCICTSQGRNPDPACMPRIRMHGRTCRPDQT